MTWTTPGAWLSGATTVSLNNQAVGNTVFLFVENADTTIFASSVSGGGCTWQQVGSKFTGTTNARSIAMFAGTVTATGSGTATITFTGGTPTGPHAVGREYHTSLGYWVLDTSGHLDSAGTNTWASLNPAVAGELYVGYAIDTGGASAGSTSGYVYNANADGSGNGALYNLNCTSSAQAPVWGDSGEAFGLMALIREQSWKVQQSKGAASATLTVSVTLGSAVTAGSKLIAYVGAAGGATISGVSDGTNSYSQVFTGAQGAGTFAIFVLDTPAGLVGTTPTITLTTTGSANGNAILVQEISGLATGTTAAAVFDGSAASSSASGTTAGSQTVPAYSSAASGEFCVASRTRL